MAAARRRRQARRCKHRASTASQVQADGGLSCRCLGCRRWQAFLQGQLLERLPWPARGRQYEVLTQEQVLALAAYLRQLCLPACLPACRAAVHKQLACGAAQDGRRQAQCCNRKLAVAQLGCLAAAWRQVCLPSTSMTSEHKLLQGKTCPCCQEAKPALQTEPVHRSRAAASALLDSFLVLEVGAGSGLLSHCLRLALGAKGTASAEPNARPHLSVVATDSGASRLNQDQPWCALLLPPLQAALLPVLCAQAAQLNRFQLKQAPAQAPSPSRSWGVQGSGAADLRACTG